MAKKDEETRKEPRELFKEARVSGLE